MHTSRGVPAPFAEIEDVVYTLDADQRFTAVNQAAVRGWGKSETELLGIRLEDGLPRRPSDATLLRYRQATEAQVRTEFEVFERLHGGWLTITLYPNHGGLIVLVRPSPRTVERGLDGNRDDLTGCLSRPGFLAALDGYPRPAVLALIDLNRLKAVNALRGHSGGDQHIRTLTHGLYERIPEHWVMGRWGGDEFTVLAPAGQADELRQLLDLLGRTLPAPFPGAEAFSAGLAWLEAEGGFEQAFALADEQLQSRKEVLAQDLPGPWEELAFLEFSRQLAHLKGPDEIIRYMLTNLLQLFDFDLAMSTALEAGMMRPTHMASRSGLPDAFPELSVPVPISGLAAEVQRTGETVWSTDYPASPHRMEGMLQRGVKSVILTPVRRRGVITAVISLMTLNHWQTITPHAQRLIELSALRLEQALELQQLENEVRASLETGLLTFGLALEARDLETHGHTRRTSWMATRIGETLGLHGEMIKVLQEGAFLHDLGKLTVPDAVLQKPGKLTPEEWSLMQAHTTSGWTLAARLPNVCPGVLEVIRHHHERWDGTGYPDELAGEAIPLAARIFAVCDVYDALISARPYKEAWTHDDAVSEIVRQSGRHFDPAVVQAFLNFEAHEPPTG